MKVSKSRETPKLYNEIYKWVISYVREDEADGLTFAVHYLAVKDRRKYLAIGIIIGSIGMGLLIKWLS